jgi:hypothetical protein
MSIGFSTTHTTPTAPVDRSVVLDTGTVAITDRRITFAGRKHARQWRLDDLICPVRGDDTRRQTVDKTVMGACERRLL